MKKFFTALTMVAVLVPSVALGATLVAQEEVSVMTGTPVEDNLYLAGGMVTVNDVINGDLLVAGGQILVTENVTEDIAAAGGNLTILGDVGGDIRIVGGSILIAGLVGGDLVGAGGSITVSPDVSVGRDLVLAGGQMNVGATVAGDAELTGGVITLTGQVQGDLTVRVEEKFTLGENAVIEGNLEYHAASEDAMVVQDGATIAGEVTFIAREPMGDIDTEVAAAALFGGFVLFKLLAALVTALVLAGLFKPFATTVARQVIQTPLNLLGLGFVALVVTPMAILVLFMTVLGIPLGFMATLAYILMLLVAGAYAGIVLGAWLSKIVRKSPDIQVTWKNVIAGVLALSIIQLVPILGWVVSFGIFLLALGSLTKAIHHKCWLKR